MKYICPTIPDGKDMNFLASGDEEAYIIFVFTSKKEYEKGKSYLKFNDKYSPLEIEINTFIELSHNDKSFKGILPNIHKNKEVIIPESFADL